jgi:hypothetical protein
MFRIDNATAVANLPIYAPPGPIPGFFSDGNPGAGQAATIVDAWWMTQIQEEILTVLNAAGIAPVKGRNTQLYEALEQLYTGTGEDPGAGRYLPLSGGTLVSPGDLTVSGTLVNSNGRMITVGGASPGMTFRNTGGGPVFNIHNAANFLCFGTADNNGSPTAALVVMNNLGNMQMPSLSVGGAVTVGATVTMGAGRSNGNFNVSGDLGTEGNFFCDFTATAAHLVANGVVTAHGLLNSFGNSYLGGHVHCNTTLAVANSITVGGAMNVSGILTATGGVYAGWDFVANNSTLSSPTGRLRFELTSGGELSRFEVNAAGIAYIPFGTNSIGFRWNGVNVDVMVDGAWAGVIPNALAEGEEPVELPALAARVAALAARVEALETA